MARDDWQCGTHAPRFAGAQAPRVAGPASRQNGSSIGHSLRIAVVASHAAERAWMLDALAEAGIKGESVALIETTPAALDTFHGQPADAVIFCMDAANPEHQGALRRSAHLAPDVPFLAVTPETEEHHCVLAVANGAQDCLTRNDLGFQGLGRALRFSLARQTFRAEAEHAHAFLERVREKNGLDRYCSSSPLTVCHRSLGLTSLRTSRPREFESLLSEYRQLFELAYEQRLKTNDGSTNEHISAFADRLGLLRTCPRDVVELHKLTLNAALDGQPSGRARAIIDDGHFFLVRLLGYLVTFYQRLCEDGRPASRLSSARHLAKTKSSSSRRGPSL